jgi:hypothetical protein
MNPSMIRMNVVEGRRDPNSAGPPDLPIPHRYDATELPIWTTPRLPLARPESAFRVCRRL